MHIIYVFDEQHQKMSSYSKLSTSLELGSGGGMVPGARNVVTWCHIVPHGTFPPHYNTALNNKVTEVVSRMRRLGYEPAGLDVHPPPPKKSDRGCVHFFGMGV